MHKAINVASSIVSDFYATLFQCVDLKAFRNSRTILESTPSVIPELKTKGYSVSRAGYCQVDRFLAQFMPACVYTSAQEAPHNPKSSGAGRVITNLFLQQKSFSQDILEP